MPDILLAREKDGYRVLHGHLRLMSALDSCSEVTVSVSEKGTVKIVKTRDGIFVGEEEGRSIRYRLYDRVEPNLKHEADPAGDLYRNPGRVLSPLLPDVLAMNLLAASYPPARRRIVFDYDAKGFPRRVR